MNRRRKGSSLVEFIVVVPCLIVFLGALWTCFSGQQAKVALMQIGRSACWRMVDWTGGDGGSSPASLSAAVNFSITNNPSPFLLGDNMFTQTDSIEDNEYTVTLKRGGAPDDDDRRIDFTFENAKSVTVGEFSGGATGIFEGLTDTMIYYSVSDLGLSDRGFFKATLSYDLPLHLAASINRMLPGGEPLPETITITEKVGLITDCWDASNQGSDNDDGQVRDRLKGYWMLGPADFFNDITGADFNISSAVSDILEFEIDLGWFGEYPLCEEQPPRINLESVPDRI